MTELRDKIAAVIWQTDGARPELTADSIIAALPEMQAEARGYARGLRDAAVICNKVRGMSVCVRDAEQTDQAHDLAVDRCQEYILARIPTDTPNQTKPPEAEI